VRFCTGHGGVLVVGSVFVSLGTQAGLSGIHGVVDWLVVDRAAGIVDQDEEFCVGAVEVWVGYVVGYGPVAEVGGTAL